MIRQKNILVVTMVSMVALSKFCFAQSQHTAESEHYVIMSQNPHKAQYATGLERLKIDLLAYLEKNLEKDILKKEGTFRLRGMVDRDKNMKKVQVIYSEDAKTGKVLKKWFEQPVGAWIPELQGGGAVKSYIDVFIKFKDAQLEVKIYKPNRAI